ncbi:unnamed protein product [Paramecium sonneborni]|uniref:Protein kinase domain-containing protein n=1 Tax=Paramecium sonneborni TaxID=65129 RepID=A0A8S1PB73_9CILI|nr:unnamed protein product [Paramecium sonneborni]
MQQNYLILKRNKQQVANDIQDKQPNKPQMYECLFIDALNGKKRQISKCNLKEEEEQQQLKVINKNPNCVNWAYEKNTLEKFKNICGKHINILKIYDIQEDEQRCFVYTEPFEMSLEYFFQEKDKTQSFSFNEICDYGSQIVKGYQCLRNQKIILRDLSPKSILIQKIPNRIILKISNFSSRSINEYEQMDSPTEIPFYIAPEELNKDQNQLRFNDSCFIYSLGIILFMMCYNGERPEKIYNSKDLKKFHENLKLYGFQYPNNPNYPKSIFNLIEKMIVYNPNNRLSWDQLEKNFTQNFLILKEIYFVDLNKPIGSGAQGVAYHAYDLKNKQELVCKTIQNKSFGISREIQIFSQIKDKQHENVIKITEIILKNDYTYLIMEKCDMSLRIYLEQIQKNGQLLSNKQIIKILYQIVEGYCFLKQLGIIHRDLKPDNILLKLNNKGKHVVKIIDFGLGKIIGQDLTSTMAGTPLYAAPEIFQGQKSYDYQCDIFSLGVILHQMAFQRMIKNIRARGELLQYHQSLKYQPFICPNHQNPLFSELINQMIVYEPTKRINWEQLQAHQIFDEIKLKHLNSIIQDPFVQSQNQQLLGQKLYCPIQQPSSSSENVKTEIYQYIISLQTLSFKIFLMFEEFQKQDQILHDEILISNKFIIRFSISCLMSILQLQQSGSIILDEEEYKLKSASNFQNWLNQINIKQLINEKKEKYNILQTAQTLNKTQIINEGNNLLTELNNLFLNKNRNPNFLHTHKYFNKFYQQVRVNFLKSNIPLKNRYFMEKFSNIFIQFPIRNYEQIKESQIAQIVCIKEKMETYINNQISNI